MWFTSASANRWSSLVTISFRAFSFSSLILSIIGSIYLMITWAVLSSSFMAYTSSMYSDSLTLADSIFVSLKSVLSRRAFIFRSSSFCSSVIENDSNFFMDSLELTTPLFTAKDSWMRADSRLRVRGFRFFNFSLSMSASVTGFLLKPYKFAPTTFFYSSYTSSV